MKKKKVSIIIPVYNAEKYLDRCLESIVNQTYKNIEILLIDDGSTDGSSELCDSWKIKDKRVVVIHKTNSGVSDTRNIGIEKATGEYITFIDSDDYIDDSMIEKLYNGLVDLDTDVSICGLKQITEDKKILFETLRKQMVMDNKQFLDELMLEKIFIGSLWGKLYKKELFDDCKLDKKLRIAEDLDLLFRLSKKINKCNTVGENLYYYYYNEESVTKVANFSKFKDELIVLEKNLNNSNVDNMLVRSRYLRINVGLFYKFRKSEPLNVVYCKRVIKSMSYKIGLSNYFTFKQKIKFLLVKLNLIV